MYLNTHTYYSLRYGTISPKSLLEQASSFGISSFALTEINSTSAHLEVLRLSKQFHIKPVLGVDFRNGAAQKFVVLAQNNSGFEAVNNYLSGFLHEENFEVPDRVKSLPDTYVIYPFSQEVFGLKSNEFIGVKPTDLTLLKFSGWRQYLDKLVILKTVSFQNKKGFNIISEDGQNIQCNKIISTLSFGQISKIFNLPKASNTIYTNFIFVAIEVSSNYVSDIHYVHDFDIENISFRTSNMGRYSNQIIDDKTFILVEIPYGNNSPIFKIEKI